MQRISTKWKKNWRNRVLAAACLWTVLPGPACGDTAGDAPRAVIETTTNAVLAVLSDKSASADDKRRRIQDIVYVQVDFDTLSRLVLAQNWRRFSAEQQKDFVDQFKQHLSFTYGRNVDSYHNEKVTVVGERTEKDGDCTVQTKILRGGADDIVVDYRLRQKDGAWRIIDFIIEGVSLVSNFRSQFQEIIANGGPEHLLQLLREKNAKGEPLKS